MKLSVLLVTFAATVFVAWMFFVVSEADARPILARGGMETHMASMSAVDGNGRWPYQAPSRSPRPLATRLRV